MTFELTEEAIKEFQKAFFLDTGIRLSQKEARDRGTRLLKLFSLIFRPIPKEVDLTVYMPKSKGKYEQQANK